MRKFSTLIITVALVISAVIIVPYVEAKVTVHSVTVTADKVEYLVGSEAIAKAQLDFTGSKKDLLGVNFTWYYPNATVAKVDLNVIPDGSGAAFSSFRPDVIGVGYIVNAVYSGDETKFHETSFDVVPAPPSNHISGSINFDTTWTYAQSPYVVMGYVYVESGTTLTIEPGVVVEFKNNTLLTVNGTLIARGSESNMITFTSNETDPVPGDWKGIDFHGAQSSSVLSYSRIEYAYKGITIYDSSPEISHNLIRDINRSGIEAYRSESYIHNNTITSIVYGYASNKGINLQSECNVIIENNIISNVEEYGIKVFNSNPQIIGNYISDSLYDIECTGSSGRIENNILYNAVNAIRIVSCQDITMRKNDITGCSGYGIRCEWSSPVVEENVIHENMDSGIWLYKCNDAEIHDNVIKYNKYGIDVQQGNEIKIDKNNIKNITNSAIVAERSKDLVISNNNIEGNENGIYVKDSKNISFTMNMVFLNDEKGLFLYNCSNSEMEAGYYSENKVGFYLHSSSFVFCNTTLLKCADRNLYLASNSKIIALNSTFDSDILISHGSELTVRNYLHILVQNETYEPFDNAELVISDNGEISFSGHTDKNGYLGFIPLTDRVYLGGNTPSENITLVTVTEDSLVFSNNPREVDMSISHSEIFGPGNPLSISIETPSNRTMVFDNINISGSAEIRNKSDVVVRISIDGGEWIYANLSHDNWTSWWVELDTSSLYDGEHLIYARISSEFFEKEEYILIVVDNNGNKPPVISLSSHKPNDIVSGTVFLNGTAFDYDGNIESVAVRVDNEDWTVATNLGGDWRSWSFSLNSIHYSNGTHKITVMAIDNSSETNSIDIDLIFKNEEVNVKQNDKEFSVIPLFAVIIPLLLCVLMFFIIKRKKDRELRERYSEEKDDNDSES